MRVTVTGAAGYVGGAVTDALLARGHQVFGFDSRLPRPVQAHGIAVVDSHDPGVAVVVAQAEAVVHLAAWVRRSADTAEARRQCFAMNAGGTREVIEAMAATGRRPHLVFVSSIAVYGDRLRGTTEAASPRPVTAYGESKLAAERIAFAAAARGAITACVLRPAVVYGPGAPGSPTQLVQLVRRGVVPRVCDGGNAKSLVHVDDLAAAIVGALESPEKSNGRAYNVAGDPITVRDMVEAIARGAGVPARWLWIPSPLVVAAAIAARALSRASGGRLPDFGRALEVFAGTATVDATAIARDLGVRFRDPVAGMEEMARGEAAR